VIANIKTSKKVPMNVSETPLRFGDTGFPIWNPKSTAYNGKKTNSSQ